MSSFLSLSTHAQHGLLREIYPGVQTGAGIPGLLANANYPNNPATVTVINEFEAPDSPGDNFGQRIRGWIEAPQTGSYIFWLASDDQGQLFLSSSERSDNKRLIAEVLSFTNPRTYDTEPNQQSLPVTLEAGQRYYIEALSVDGQGDDHLSVRWQLPDGTIEEPIPNERLFVELIPPIVARQAQNVTVPEGSLATFAIQLVNRGAVDIQWLRNDVPIPDATNLTFTIPRVTLADNGLRFRVSLSNAFVTNAILSNPAFLTVIRDVTPPTLLAAQTSGDNGLLTLAFSEPVEPVSATSIANYQVSGGVQVQSATVDPSGRTVILRTTPFTFGQSYFVAVNNVKDLASVPNVVEPETQGDFDFGYTPLAADLVYGRTERPGPSTRRTGLTFSEIMYHPAPRTDGRNIQFIEIYNSESSIVNIGGYRIIGTVNYTFPEGTFLPAQSYAVVAAVPEHVQTLYGLPKVYGPFEDSLGSSGGLQFLNDQGAVLLEVEYAASGDWPAAPNGAGPSLVLARPSFGEADPRAWEASDAVGGSPGRAESPTANSYKGVVINELLSNTDLPAVDYIELYNYNSQAIDLSGVVITDDISTNKFVVPTGTIIPALGFVVFDEATLGFALSSAGERIIMRNPQRTRVLQAVDFGPQGLGVPLGRFPDGNPRLRALSAGTKGQPNVRPSLPSVVINEIMYNPVSGNDEEEYIELYNRTSQSVSLKGWRLNDGISFTFGDISIAANAYLVVAKNVELLRANHSNVVTSANSIGNFSGNLGNGGERVTLERPEGSPTSGSTNVFYVVVNEVNYKTGGRWPRWADGGGSSMELVDPNADTEEASNWADSDETQKSSWVTIERRGIMSQGATNSAQANPSRNIHVLLTDGGEALIDNIQVFLDGGANIVRNPGFERGVSDWLVGGTHEETTLELGGGNGGGNALHIRAVERGDTSVNRIRGRLNAGLTNGNIATIRADVRWLRGTPEILLRLHGNYLELPGRMQVPTNLGTPGARNGRAIANAAPNIASVEHRPILPVANQPVEVRAQLDDPDQLAAAALYYRVDPGTNFTRVAMSYRGAGYYSGSIPGQTNLSTVAFYIESFDARGGTARFPANAPTNTGVILFGDGRPGGTLGVYRLWLTQTNITRWTTRERASNKPIDATFVYNDERVVYNMGTLYSGSPFHWSGYSGPLGSSANYLMVFPDDDLFLGQNDFVLNLPSNLGSDSTGVREQVFFWMADQLNQPFNYRRFHYLFLNGRNRGLNSAGTLRVYEDSQQPSRDFLEQWFPDDPDGDLHKIEDWFEFDDNGGSRFNVDAELIAVLTTNLTTGLPELKQERYRWWFRKRAIRDSAHDYSELFRLVRAVNEPDEARYVAETRALVDIDEWMGAIALRHAVGDWDSFGYARGKNMYAYKPQNGRWTLMHWDIAFAFGLGDGTQTDLFSVTHFDGSLDTITKRMMETPEFRRAYYRALYQIVNGPFIAARVNAVIDNKYSALVQNGITVTPPDDVKQWIAERRDYMQSQLANVSAGFAVNSAPSTTNRNSLVLTGSAPVQVKTIRINEQEYPVNWTSETTWEIRIALKPQQNVLHLQGYDAFGMLVPDASASVTVNVTGTPEAINGKVVINEIQYNPAVPDSGFIEVHNSARNTSYDLSGYRINGADFIFPSGSVIAPGGFLVIVNDTLAFGDQYGYTIPIAGEYAGRLQDAGETLSLVGFDATGTNEVVISAVRYEDIAPWPVQADGTGGSLQLIDPTQDASRVGNWAAVAGVATPGAVNGVRGTVTPFPLVWVNEVVPNNVNGRTDSAGEHDPWVELYNSSGAAVSLANLYLTDDYAQLTKWAFPAGASIPAGGRIIVWLDGEANESGTSELHTSFRLRATDGSIALVGQQAGGPAVFDYLSFGQLAAGHSFGAFPEGQAVRRESFFSPTPGAANTLSAPPASVFINEWLADNGSTIQDPDDNDFDDWIELYNAGSEAVDLSGFTLTDDLANPDQFELPAGTIIPAKGFLLIWADNENSTNGLHATFRLSADGETIGLFAPDGSVVDSVTFGPQTVDVSSGRSPDGGSQIVEFTNPTPGASNGGGIDPNALQFTSITIANGQVRLNWNAQTGATYRVEYKNSLAEPAWTLLGNVTATGSSGVTTDNLTNGNRFYRLVK